MNMALTDAEIVELVAYYRDNVHLFSLFQKAVEDNVRLAPELHAYPHPIVHSIKTRLKDPDHLVEKIRRKEAQGRSINRENVFSEITDLAGVRVLHLYQAQAAPIHQFLIGKIRSREWVLVEKPVAYSWDPDACEFFEGLGLRVKIKPSHYTSIHYVVRPKKNAISACEIQVRTLFEEIWGEIDHTVNYPTPTENIATREQLRVLSKLVSTGSRLADSVFKLQEFNTQRASSPESGATLS